MRQSGDKRQRSRGIAECKVARAQGRPGGGSRAKKICEKWKPCVSTCGLTSRRAAIKSRQLTAATTGASRARPPVQLRPKEMTALEFGLDTFGDVTRGASGAPLSHAQTIRNVIEEAVIADE